MLCGYVVRKRILREICQRGTVFKIKIESSRGAAKLHPRLE